MPSSRTNGIARILTIGFAAIVRILLVLPVVEASVSELSSESVVVTAATGVGEPSMFISTGFSADGLATASLKLLSFVVLPARSVEVIWIV
jgi:hypothetical protein